MSRAEIEPGKASNINPFERTARRLTVTVSNPLLKHEMTDKDHSVEKAKEALGRGEGVMILFNHFSTRDPPLIISIAFEMGSKKVVAPIASHMDHLVYHVIGKLIGVTIKPIVTKNTVKENKNRKLGDGMIRYHNNAIRFLKEGGIVAMSPQGTRMPHLGEPDNRTVGSFMAAAKGKHFETFNVLVIGLGIKGIDDYSDRRGLNPHEIYTVNIGSCLTRQELMDRAGNDPRAVDGIVYEELRKVIPSSYR